MENVRRKLKIFWTEHGTPILFWIIVGAVVITVIQLLNYISIQKLKNKNILKEKDNSVTTQNIYEENKEYTILINQFLEHCKKRRYRASI